jgi:hypothetical protein
VTGTILDNGAERQHSANPDRQWWERSEHVWVKRYGWVHMLYSIGAVSRTSKRYRTWPYPSPSPKLHGQEANQGQCSRVETILQSLYWIDASPRLKEFLWLAAPVHVSSSYVWNLPNVSYPVPPPLSTPKKCPLTKNNDVISWRILHKSAFTGFIRGILRGVRYAKSLRVLFLHRRSPSWTTLVLYSRVVFIFNEPTICFPANKRQGGGGLRLMLFIIHSSRWICIKALRFEF